MIEVKDNEAVIKYELRELKSTDLGAICKIIMAIGIKEFKNILADENIKALIEESKAEGKVDKNGKVDREAVGFGIIFDVASIIISNIPKAEKEIQSFAASVAGMKITEIQELSFADYGEMLMKIVMKDDFKDFFGRAIKLFK